MSNSGNQGQGSTKNAAAAGRQIPIWLKWSAGFCILLAAFSGIFLLFLPMGLNQDLLRSRLQSQIADWSGMSLAVKGDVDISFFPFKASLHDVTSNDALGAVTVTAKKLEARFSALSVLTGKVDVKELWLDGARITMRQRPGALLGKFGASGPLKPAIESARAAIDADRSNPDLDKIANRPLGSVRLTDSSLSYIWADGREDRIMNLNANLQWLKLRGGAAMDGTAFWRGEPLDFNVSVASPLLLASGGSSGLSVDFKSAPVSFAYSGAANLASDFFADGSLSLNAASVSRVLSWSAAPMTATGNLGALGINAKLTTSEGKLKFGDLKLLLDNNPATGTLEIDPVAKPVKLSGTLAFEKMDFASLAEALQLEQADEPGDGRDASALSGIDLDLRLSAETANAGQLPMTDAAGTIRVDGGNILLDLGNAGIAGGDITGSLHIEGPKAARQAVFKFSARNVMADQLFKSASVLPAVSAPMSLQADLSGAYKNWLGFVQTGQGSLRASAEPGTIRNFSADSFAAAVRNGQIFALADAYSGLSPLEKATLTATLKQGVAIVDASELLIGGQRILLAGAIPYQTGGVALNGMIAMQSDLGNPAPFFVGGSWDKPFVTLVPLTK